MFSLKSPSEYAGGLLRRLTSAQKTAFLSTFLIGFFCHLFIFTNSMYNNDDIRYLYVTFDKPELGRWLQTYAAGISSYFSLPVINGLLALLYASVTSMVLVHMFQLENKLGILLISGLFVTFPTVACLYSYMFAADPFLLSCCFSTCAAYFVTCRKHKAGWLLGAVFLCCSVGIYQAYLSFTLLLMLLYFILMLLQPEKYPDKEIWSIGIRYILMLVSGMGAYYIGMTLTLKFKHMELSSYQGIGESSVPNITDIKNRLFMVFHDFIEFFRPTQVLSFNPWMKLALLISFLLLTLFFCDLYRRHKIYQSFLRNVLLLFCGVCIPLSVNVLYLISDGVGYHMLMRHSWCLLFIAVLIFYEKAAPHLGITVQKLLEWIAFAAAFIVVWNYILLSNIAYFNMNFRYEKTYALCVKIIDRIEQSQDYDRHRKLAFIGNYSKTYKMDAVSDLLDPMTGTSGARIFKGASRAYLPFFQNCLGEDIEVVSPEEEKSLSATPEFQEMPYFPDAGSVRVINDVTVIKLNDE